MSKGIHETDTLDRTVAFLQKRDGIDKTLKICRYSAKLALAVALHESKTDIAQKLKSFESSVGTSRKAFRLGKFLQNVNTLRKTPLTTVDGVLELVATTGEGIYYFVEQFVWLVKTGALDKHHSKKLQKISAWAEFIGYFGSVAVKSLHIVSLRETEAKLLTDLQKKGEGRNSVEEEEREKMLRKLKVVQFKKLLKTLSVVQDFADGLLALNDIWDSEGPLNRPGILASAGLLSALISAHKNWHSV